MIEEIYNYTDPDLRAKLISLRILSQIEMICDERGISKKQLAVCLGTSASYITQLYRGDKKVNLNFMAKVENVLDIKFEISIK